MTELNEPDKSIPVPATSAASQLVRLFVGVVWVLGALAVIAGFFWLIWPYLKPVLMRFYD